MTCVFMHLCIGVSCGIFFFFKNAGLYDFVFLLSKKREIEKTWSLVGGEVRKCFGGAGKKEM